MKNKVLWLFIINFVIFSNRLFAININENNTNDKSKQELTLVDVLEIALKNNPKVKESWLNIDSAKYSYRSELSNYLPTVKGELSYDNSRNKYNDKNTPTTKSDYLTPSISLSYLLFDFGGREADVLNFKYKLNAVKYESSSFMQNFIYQVTEAYYNLFSSLANKKASIESENSSHEAFKAATIRYDLGLVPLTDKLQAETSYIQKKLAREKAENTVKIKQANLNYLLNLSPNSEIDLKIPLMNIPDDSFDENVANLIGIAIQNRPDLKSYYETKKAKKAEVWSNANDWLPTVSLNASYGERNDRINDINRTNYNIGVNASMPFFTGGYIYNNVAKSRSELKIMNEKINDLEKDIELDVWTAYQNFITAKRTYITSETLLKNAIETEKTMLGRYKNGKASILDLLNTQTDLATARYEFINSQHNWFINKANLIRAIGSMSVEELKTLTIAYSSNNININNGNQDEIKNKIN